MNPSSLLEWLQSWCLSKCDGEWEHGKGVKIDTLDNPGWSVEVDVGAHTDRPLHVVERGEHDWIRCEIKDQRFVGFGGPGNLAELLSLLRDWVEPPAS